MKKIFENAVWWSGVIMVGLILGVSLQFVRAWTEPTDAPPNGNVGAPINTGPITQIKNGILSLVGLSTSYINVPGVVPAAGNVLTAQNAAGQVAWAAGVGGNCFTYYCNRPELNPGAPNKCTNSGGLQGYCPSSSFQQKYDMGTWGICVDPSSDDYDFRPPGGGCYQTMDYSRDIGKAYLCCM